jgi:hypothetical protein
LLQGASIVGHLLADAECVRSPAVEDGLELATTVAERQATEIVVAMAKKVERDHGDRLRFVDVLNFTRARQVNSSLKALKSGRLPLFV